MTVEGAYDGDARRMDKLGHRVASSHPVTIFASRRATGRSVTRWSASSNGMNARHRARPTAGPQPVTTAGAATAGRRSRNRRRGPSCRAHDGVMAALLSDTALAFACEATVLALAPQ